MGKVTDNLALTGSELRKTTIAHHSIGRLQIEASSRSSDGQQKDEGLAVGGIELLDGFLPAPGSNFYHKNQVSCLAACQVVHSCFVYLQFIDISHLHMLK